MKILQIGPYPPPNSGWSVRIKFLKEAFQARQHDCRVLNLGKNRKIKHPEYIDVQGGFDFFGKLIFLKLKGYHFHIHVNAQAIKGPILALAASCVSILFGERPALTFHGGVKQLYFPKENGRKMHVIIWLNFVLAKIMVCNNDPIKQEICRYGPFIASDKIHPIPAFSVQYLAYEKMEIPKRITDYLASKKHNILCYIVLRNCFFIETVVQFLKSLSPEIGVILIGVGDVEDKEILKYHGQLKELESKGAILSAEDLNHDEFITLMGKCDLYLRTPVSDGIASSVLEALCQNVPVVASENGRRPESVVTYKADDANDLRLKALEVLADIELYKEKIVRPSIRDTVADEIERLVDAFTSP